MKVESPKYCREIADGNPLRLDRGQNQSAGALAWQNSPRVPTIGSVSRARPRGLRMAPLPSIPDVQTENDPMAAIGRLGQFLGLSVPAVAVLLELNHAISLGQMLVMLVASLCCFWIGRIIEGYARR